LPAFIDIELTNRCNLRCDMCWFHGTNGIGDRYGTSELTTDEVLGLIERLAAYRPSIYLGGGEPLIRDDLGTIAACVKRHGLPLSLTTNGTLLDTELISTAVRLGVDNLNISLDGPPDVHDALRGPGVYARVVDNLNEVLRVRAACGGAKPVITVNVTIGPSVVGRLRETVGSIRSETADGVDEFVIHHRWFITPAELQAHQDAVGKALGLSAPGARAHLLPSVESIDLAALSEELSQLRGTRGVTFFPDLQGGEIREYYSEGYRANKRCRASLRVAVIKPNGDVRFCPDEWIDDYVLGNIREDRLEDIWTNVKAERFRAAVRRCGSFPGCQRCSWMHSF